MSIEDTNFAAGSATLVSANKAGIEIDKELSRAEGLSNEFSKNSTTTNEPVNITKVPKTDKDKEPNQSR